MGYCHYTQLVSTCRKLEDENERIAVGLVGTGRSMSRNDVEVRQQTTLVAGARTDNGATPKRETHGDGDGTPSLANLVAADKPGTVCSVCGASNCEEREESPQAGQIHRETEVCVDYL